MLPIFSVTSRKNDPMTHARLVYEGSKTFWRESITADIIIAAHKNESFVEIIAYDAVLDLEAPRLYVEMKVLDMKLNKEDIEHKLRESVETMVRKKETFNRKMIEAKVKDQVRISYVTSKMYIVKRSVENREFEVDLRAAFADTIRTNRSSVDGQSDHIESYTSKLPPTKISPYAAQHVPHPDASQLIKEALALAAQKRHEAKQFAAHAAELVGVNHHDCCRGGGKVGDGGDSHTQKQHHHDNQHPRSYEEGYLCQKEGLHDDCVPPKDLGKSRYGHGGLDSTPSTIAGSDAGAGRGFETGMEGEGKGEGMVGEGKGDSMEGEGKGDSMEGKGKGDSIEGEVQDEDREESRADGKDKKEEEEEDEARVQELLRRQQDKRDSAPKKTGLRANLQSTTASAGGGGTTTATGSGLVGAQSQGAVRAVSTLSCATSASEQRRLERLAEFNIKPKHQPAQSPGQSPGHSPGRKVKPKPISPKRSPRRHGHSHGHAHNYIPVHGHSQRDASESVLTDDQHGDRSCGNDNKEKSETQLPKAKSTFLATEAAIVHESTASEAAPVQIVEVEKERNLEPVEQPIPSYVDGDTLISASDASFVHTAVTSDMNSSTCCATDFHRGSIEGKLTPAVMASNSPTKTQLKGSEAGGGGSRAVLKGRRRSSVAQVMSGLAGLAGLVGWGTRQSVRLGRSFSRGLRGSITATFAADSAPTDPTDPTDSYSDLAEQKGTDCCRLASSRSDDDAAASIGLLGQQQCRKNKVYITGAVE